MRVREALPGFVTGVRNTRALWPVWLLPGICDARQGHLGFVRAHQGFQGTSGHSKAILKSKQLELETRGKKKVPGSQVWFYLVDNTVRHNTFRLEEIIE